jgi:hypothetical protein
MDQSDHRNIVTSNKPVARSESRCIDSRYNRETEPTTLKNDDFLSGNGEQDNVINKDSKGKYEKAPKPRHVVLANRCPCPWTGMIKVFHDYLTLRVELGVGWSIRQRLITPSPNVFLAWRGFGMPVHYTRILTRYIC